MLQPEPFVFDVTRQPEAAADISISFVIGIFAMAGVMLLAAGIGSVIVGGVLILIQRHRGRRPLPPEQNARRLRI
jgi:hypothetical protein